MSGNESTRPAVQIAASHSMTARILKLMSMFSGLQLVSILCSVIKMKLVALWLGSYGVGLFGIYQSVADTTATFTDMGIRNSSVRDVASAQTPGRLAAVVRTVRRWSIISGLLGAIVMVALAVPLGNWFFGTAQGCWGFLVLGVAMFLNALCGGEQALLQGAGRLKALARANLLGTVCGLVLSVPLFYWCGFLGVVLSIVAYAVTMTVALMRSRLRAPAAEEEKPEEGRRIPEFVRLGLYMAAAAFITSLAHTVFIGLLNAVSSTAEVGLVQAGDTLVVRYIGLVFVAIGMEFYPRIAANIHYRQRVRVFVNHEIILLLLCLIPLLCLFLLLREPVVTMLYSAEFAPIIPFVSWAALSSIPKAVSWCMAYTIVAKGDGRIYILTEGADALVSVPLCLAAYHVYGLTGLGVAYIVWYLLYAVFTGLVYYRRYGLRLSGRCLGLSVTAVAVTVLFLLGVEYLPFGVMAVAFVIIAIPPLLALRRQIK